VAAAIHYIFGLNATLFTELPAFNSLNSSLKSVKSHTLTVFSFPPVAMYVPNGAIAKELMLSWWALKVYLIEKLWFQIFNLPSQPAVAKYGFFGTGEYLTHETHSVWLLVSLVYLQSANVFHNLKVLSAPAEIIYLLSNENVHDNTSFVWPTNFLLVLPVLKSHNLNVLSHELDKAYMLSYDNWTSETKWLWPVKDLNGTPAYLFVFSS